MTAQDLKNAILQLAVQGKLVPQDSTEAKAEVQGIKQKPTEELDFDIPQTWKTAHLESISNTIPSKQFQILESEVRKTGRFPVISQSKDYTIGFSDETDKVFYHDEPVIAFGDHTTEVKYVTFDFVIGADGVKLFVPNTNVVFPLFLYYTLQYYTIGLNKVGGYSRHYKYIKNKPIPLPPLAEQRRIVSKIEELKPLVEEYGNVEERLTTLNAGFPDKLRKSILQQAIQGKLTERDPADEPASELLKRIRAEKERLIKEGKIKKEKPLPPITEEEMPFEIPENWEWVRWGDLSQSIQYGYNAPAKAKGIIRMVRISDIQDNHVLWDTVPYCDISEDEISNYLLADNDILFARTGGTVGKSFLVKDVPYEAIYAGYLIRTQYSKMLVPEYMKFFMESQLYWDQLRSGTIATAQPNCNGKTLAKMILPLPPLAEQQRIVDRVNVLLAVCDELK